MVTLVLVCLKLIFCFLSFIDQYLVIKCTRDIPKGGEILNCYGWSLIAKKKK